MAVTCMGLPHVHILSSLGDGLDGSETDDFSQQS